MTDKMWTEAYRPETLDEIIGHEGNIKRLKKYVDDSEVPHMLFAGPAGTGKTASITAFAKEVFGDGWRTHLYEMNASDQRGIDVIRDKVKGIARQNPGEADYQIIFLDEADQLSSDAQPALRRIMEDNSDNTRFFLSCNWVNQIIEPIQSRCSLFRFGRLDDEEIREVLENVIEGEDLDVDPFAADAIINHADGDARSAINALQSANVDGEVTEETTKTVVGVINQKTISDIVDLAIEGELDEAMRRLDVEVMKEGANPSMLASVFLRVLKHKNMPEPGRVKCIDKLAECEWRIQHGSNPNVQFHSLLADINVGYHLTLENYDKN